MKPLSIVSILLLPLVPVSCVFNPQSPDSQIIEAETIIDNIRDGKAVYFENKTIEGELDFTKLVASVESESMKRIQIPESVTLMNCHFKGKIKCFEIRGKQTTVCTFRQNLTLSGSTMDSAVSFRETVFIGKANFASCIFKEVITCEGGRFESEAYFTKSNFQQEARFQNCLFSFKSNWLEAIFEKPVSYQNTTFDFDAQFSATIFIGYADFGLCVFRGHAFFNYSRFDTQAIFSNSAFFGRFEMIEAEFGKNTEMKSCLFYSSANLAKAKVNGTFLFDFSTFVTGVPDRTGWIEGKLFSLSMLGARYNSFESLKPNDVN